MIGEKRGKLIGDFYVEFPPGGLWVGDCEIYPKDSREYACVHICDKHIILVSWGWVECNEEDVWQSK